MVEGESTGGGGIFPGGGGMGRFLASVGGTPPPSPPVGKTLNFVLCILGLLQECAKISTLKICTIKV